MERIAEKLDTLQSVELAEGIEIRLRVAGPMSRAKAYLLDFLIRLAVMVVVSIVIGIAGIAIGGQVVIGLLLLLWFFLEWGYPVVFEAGKRGATPGKRAMGLRVVQSSGSPITFGQAVVRNFMRFADSMPLIPLGVPLITYGFGLASCLATKRFQRLGDLAAGTVVIYDRLPPEPAIQPPPPMGAVRPPVALTPDETRSVVMFRERSGLWSEARQRELADHVSELSGATGAAGVSRLMAMAHWLQEKRKE